MALKIRTIRKEDWEALSFIHESAFKEIGETRESILTQFADPQFQWFIADKGTPDRVEVVGYTGFRVQDSFLYWSWLAVTPHNRGAGIGEALFQKVKEFTLSQGIKSMHGDTRNRYREGLVFHLRHGFDVIGTYLDSDGELMIKIRAELRE